ncbi:branched-chain amino acid aminotransferase/4-amino-4-deoxychorismate lyase, partial [mine drainage metagenome]
CAAVGSLSMSEAIPPIFSTCSSWAFEVPQMKSFAPRHLARQALGGLAIHLAVHLLDQADHVPHAQNARGHALGIEWRQGIGLLSDAHEHDGLARDLAHGQRRSAAGIAVGLGQYDAGQLERRREGSRRVDGVLPRHGVDHEQALRRMNGLIDLTHLFHERLIDVQPSGRIDDEDVEHPPPGLLERAARNLGRRQRRIGGQIVGLNLLRQPLEL